MATEVKIPAMGESISSGILASWHVKDGDYVSVGQTLFELETDKITSEGNAEVAGTISLKVQADEEVEIGQVVALIDESATAPSGAGSESPTPEAAPQAAAQPKATPEPAAAQTPPAAATPAPAPEAAPAASGATPPLSPAPRKIAEETGVDIATISGSGKDGRVTKGDILQKAQANASAPEPAAVTHIPADTASRETRKKMSPLRRKIAEHLVAATQEAAMLTTFNEVDMSAVMQLRKTHQEAFVEKHGIKLGFMSFFTKAATHALQAVPQVNARIEGDTIVSQHYYDIGVAVGTPKGLMVPVVHDCDRKNFAEIETDILNYAKAAREGKIEMQDLQGGVFTISNGGIYGSMLSTPIINHPQPAILGLHNIQERPVVRDGEIVARPMMYLALSYDHRLIDGKEAVTFLIKIKEAIEDPSRLLFGI